MFKCSRIHCLGMCLDQSSQSILKRACESQTGVHWQLPTRDRGAHQKVQNHLCEDRNFALAGRGNVQDVKACREISGQRLATHSLSLNVRQTKDPRTHQIDLSKTTLSEKSLHLCVILSIRCQNVNEAAWIQEYWADTKERENVQSNITQSFLRQEHIKHKFDESSRTKT